MGKRGVKPTPTHLRIIAGNPSRRPLNQNEPMPQGDLREPPVWMTDSQKEGWNYAIEHAPPGLLKKLDRSVLTVWVVAEDTHRLATLKVAEQGLTVISSKGDDLQSPYLLIQHKQALVMMKAAAEMGFTPSSRSQISVEPTRGNAFANNGRRTGET